MSDVAGDDVDSDDDIATAGDAADAAGSEKSDQQPATRLPADAEPWTCPHCGFQLPEEQQYRLHLGLEHYGRLEEADREQFKSAYSEEETALNRFRIIALGGLVLLYFGFLLVYAVFAA